MFNNYSMNKLKIVKTISYRLLSSTVGLIIIYSISGSFKAGALFSVLELIYKPVQYYFHERLWINAERKAMINDNA